MTAPINPQLDPQQSPIAPHARSAAHAGANARDRDHDGDDATRLSVSASSLGSSAQAVSAENLAAAASTPQDINQAAELVRQLAAQFTADAGHARAAQANVTARNALSLLA